MRYLFYSIRDSDMTHLVAMDVVEYRYYYLTVNYKDKRLDLLDEPLTITYDLLWNFEFIKWGNDLGFIYDYEKKLSSTPI